MYYNVIFIIMCANHTIINVFNDDDDNIWYEARANLYEKVILIINVQMDKTSSIMRSRLPDPHYHSLLLYHL